jgi:AraC family carnitine catabolism transcriptional activator
MRLMVDAALGPAGCPPTLIVCAGFDPARGETKSLLSILRRLYHAGVVLGAMDTGAHILAKAGLLDGVPVTLHWEAAPAFREEFPQIEVSDELFEVQRKIFTCAGGTAALDLMLDMISRKHGADLAAAVSEQFIHDRIRSSHDHQRMQLSARLKVTNSKVLKVVELIERHIEHPLSLDELAQRTGVSPRQMERLFGKTLKTTPGRYYREARLVRARQLLRQTDMPVIDVAIATGFSSGSCLSRLYRQQFGSAPRDDRRDLATEA